MPSLNFAPLLLAVINLKRRLQNRKDHVRIEKESGMAILVTHHECWLKCLESRSVRLKYICSTESEMPLSCLNEPRQIFWSSVFGLLCGPGDEYYGRWCKLGCEKNNLRSFSCSLSMLVMVSSKWRLIALVWNCCQGYRSSGTWVFTCSSMDSAKRSASTCKSWHIAVNCKIVTHLVGFLESALVLDSFGNFSLEFLCARYNLLLDSLKSRGEFIATALTIRLYFSLLRGNEIFMTFDVSLDL